ncbi:MAG: MBL fold metallo-hydrolase [Actinomycetota bacterium]|nr:MBL fold metallo-hydrolase [Actinomycetota bacterium]
MRLTVLGSSASYAGAGQATAGYLVEVGDVRVLLDCGHGALANLAMVTDPLGLEAVFVSHGHIDHFADIYALQALLRFAPEGPAAPCTLYVPCGLFGRMGAVLTDHAREELVQAFDVHELAAKESVLLGGLSVTPYPVDHMDPTFALVVEADGTRLCYTSDTAPGEAVLEAARGCDLLLAECTLPQKYSGMAAHMTAAQAAGLARDAGAKRLVLTHLWPTSGRDTLLREAAAIFDGPISVAREFETHQIGGSGRQ